MQSGLNSFKNTISPLSCEWSPCFPDQWEIWRSFPGAPWRRTRWNLLEGIGPFLYPGRPKPFLGTDMNSHGSRWELDIICSVTETWWKLGKGKATFSRSGRDSNSTLSDASQTLVDALHRLVRRRAGQGRGLQEADRACEAAVLLSPDEARPRPENTPVLYPPCYDFISGGG